MIYEEGLLFLQYFPLPPGPVPKPSPKGAYGKVRLQFSGTIFDNLDDLCPRGPTTSQLPLSFEVLRQIHGFVLYRNVILQQFSDPTILEIPGLRDRAYIFVDKVSGNGNVTSAARAWLNGVSHTCITLGLPEMTWFRSLWNFRHTQDYYVPFGFIFLHQRFPCYGEKTSPNLMIQTKAEGYTLNVAL